MAIADLRFVGAPVDDPVATARYIAGMILTKRQKANLLKTYLSEKGVSLSSEIRSAADQYAEHL
jgi:hypothetical protein